MSGVKICLVLFYNPHPTMITHLGTSWCDAESVHVVVHVADIPAQLQIFDTTQEWLVRHITDI